MWDEAEKFLLKDKYIGPLIKTWGHCTIKFRPHKDYFGHIAGNIIGQQLSGKVADVIEGRFIKAVGGKVTGKKWDKINSPKFAEKNWKPYRTVASWYLWRSLENR